MICRGGDAVRSSRIASPPLIGETTDDADEHERGDAMSFNPAGTRWSVYSFSGDSMTGEPDSHPWEFNQDSTMSLGARRHGKYEPISGTDDAYLCEVTTVGSGVPQRDRFVVNFVTPSLFVATKEGSLYRIGKRIEAILDVMILVDTISLTQDGNGVGSTNDAPAECDHGVAIMIADQIHAESGNGTADLHLHASSRGKLRIWGASLSNQLRDEVFVYDFQHQKGDSVLDTRGMRSQTASTYAMVPHRGADNHNPPVVEKQKVSFNYSLLDIVNTGTEYFYVKLVVYGPADDNGDRPVKGYFRWDPSITAA
jgi:hypothetical protein